MALNMIAARAIWMFILCLVNQYSPLYVNYYDIKHKLKKQSALIYDHELTKTNRLEADKLDKIIRILVFTKTKPAI
jgi:hypothetical protein